MDILYIVKLFPLKITKSSQEKTKNYKCMDKNSPHWAGYTERPYLKKHSFRIKVRTRLFFIGCEL